MTETLDPGHVSPGSQSKDGIVISMVVPTFREYHIAESLDRLTAHLRDLVGEHGYEVLVVDDSPPDAAALISEYIAAHPGAGVILLEGPRRGKGAAVRQGISASRGEVVVLTDADLSVGLDQVGTFVDLIRKEGLMAVIGERTSRPSTPMRRVLSVGLSLLVRNLILPGTPVQDTQCGFKAFSGPWARGAVQRMIIDGGMLDVEILALCARNRVPMRAVGLGRLPETRPTRIRLMRCLVNDPRDLLTIRMRALLGRYDLGAARNT